MSYVIPDGTTLGEILSLRYGDAPGIATRETSIVEWPVELGSQPTQQEITSLANNINALRSSTKRSKIKSQLRDNHPDRVLLRATIKVLMNSLNEARNTINDLRSAVVNASSLADLKTRAAAVSALTNRNWNQALTAVEQTIDAGQAEE